MLIYLILKITLFANNKIIALNIKICKSKGRRSCCKDINVNYIKKKLLSLIKYDSDEDIHEQVLIFNEATLTKMKHGAKNTRKRSEKEAASPRRDRALAA